MSTTCRRIDDVALWKIFKSVDAATLQKCRRVSTKWNGEILRLNNHTSKFQPNSLIMELDGSKFKITVGTPNSREGFEQDPIEFETMERVLRHVASPETLMILLNYFSDIDAYKVMMNGIKNDWSSNIKEIEIVSHNPNLQLSRVISHLEKFPNLDRLSISHYCSEMISIGNIFEMLPELRYLRIYGFNSNDGSGCSSGLIFDDNAVEQLMKNQKKYRKIQRLELFNTDLIVSMDVMTDALRNLARLPIHPNMLKLKSEDPEDSKAVHFLFENCQWNSIKEGNLLSSIIRISSQFIFPIQQNDDNVLKGDFRFSIFETSFILKFMV